MGKETRECVEGGGMSGEVRGGHAPPQKIFRILFRKRLHFKAFSRAFKQV